MPKVYLTIYGPDRPVEVPDHEVPILRHQGLLIEDNGETAGPPAGAPPKSRRGGSEGEVT